MNIFPSSLSSMPPPRIVADGLWRALCPSFEALTVSKVRTPLQNVVRRANTKTRSPRARASISASQRRCTSTYTTITPTPEPLAPPGKPSLHELPSRSKRSERRKPNLNIDLESATTEELHNQLREIRDVAGAYNHIIDVVQHLVEARHEKPSLRQFDALIRANADAQHGSAEVVEELLREMDKEGIIGDSGLYHGVMMTLAVHPNHLLRAEVLEEMRERWITLSPTGHCHLVVSHLRDREYELALLTLGKMKEGHIPVPGWLYDILIYVLAEAGEHETALQLLQQVAENPDLNPLEPYSSDDVGKGVWPYFLDSAAAAYEYESVFYVWRKRVEVGYVRPSDGTLVNILNTAALAGDSGLATDALKMLAERGGKLEVGAYEALLESYCGSGDIGNAMRVLGIMERAAMGEGMSGVGRPDSGSTRPLYMLLKDAGTDGIEAAWECLREIQQEGGDVPIAAVNVCIEAAEMSGDLDLAMSFYDELKAGMAAAKKEARREAAKKNKIGWRRKKAAKSTEVEAIPQDTENRTLLATAPDVTTINLLLQGCGKAFSTGQHAPYILKERAMFLAAEMVELGLKATPLTYDRLILVCLGQEDYEDALNYLGEMEALGWRNKLRGGTWNALVRRLARQGDGRVDELLAWMEEDGHRVGLLKGRVQQEWGKGWVMALEERKPIESPQPQPQDLPKPQAEAETQEDGGEVEGTDAFQAELDAMFGADEVPAEEEQPASRLQQFVKARLTEPVPEPVKSTSPTPQPLPASSFKPKFGPLAQR